MNRRQALRTTALLGAMALSPSLLRATENIGKPSLGGIALDAGQIALLDEIADTMLPTTTDSPGAKAAGCGKVMAGIIKDCYVPEDGKLFTGLLAEINQKSQAQFKNDFTKLSFENRLKVLTPFDVKKGEAYVKMKELAVFVYFTSKPGMNQALRYLEVPGKYDGSLPLHKGDKAWAWSYFTY
ncbi:MAG TPA: gluconate 2-dehydrogenase subunit 3 family protein [Mucilaginibacter sp.]|jgi:hypothetical protein